MRYERIVLLVFFGDYLINEVAAGLSALVPMSGEESVWNQYIVFVVLAVLIVSLLAWWFLITSAQNAEIKTGVVFGVVGVVVSIAVTFVSGIFGMLFDTGSVFSILDILPNFLPYLWDVSTIVLIAYWVLPAALVGWLLERKTA